MVRHCQELDMAIIIVNAKLSITVLAIALVSLLAWQQKSQRPLKPLNNLQKKLARQAEKLVPLHSTMGPTRPGDWLATHNEPGQTFQQYLNAAPVRVSAKRKTLYVLPLGSFDENQQKIVNLSADFLGRYFSCKVKTMETLSLDDAIPQDARRVHPSWGVRQIKSTYVLYDVLKKRLPRDAVALIALTSSDLYPDDDWNFVFGQASLSERVGVWSFFRNGDPETEFKTCLRRTLKTATHETGHMFSIQHCTAYNCNMCGSNSLTESDRRPLYLCPECVPKVWWATKSDNVTKRFESLKDFFDEQGMKAESKFYGAAIQAIR